MSNRTIGAVCFLIFTTVGNDRSLWAQSANPEERIQAKVAVEPVTNLAPHQLAGRYANPPEDLKHTGPSLVGNNLYLFPDRTYVYCQWANIMANTIFDKGTWKFAAGVIELSSDRDVTWNSDLERSFLAVRRAHHAEEIMLVGSEKAVRRFETPADDPELLLLTVAKKRARTIGWAEAAGIKTALMREAWRPKSFGQR